MKNRKIKNISAYPLTKGGKRFFAYLCFLLLLLFTIKNERFVFTLFFCLLYFITSIHQYIFLFLLQNLIYKRLFLLQSVFRFQLLKVLGKPPKPDAVFYSKSIFYYLFFPINLAQVFFFKVLKIPFPASLPNSCGKMCFCMTNDLFRQTCRKVIFTQKHPCSHREI